VKQLDDPTRVAEELVRLLRHQRQYYQELKRLAEQQRALIQAEQPEELLGLLAKRQQVVDAMGKVHQQLAAHQQIWNASKEKLDAKRRQEIQELLAELETMLNDLLEHDQQDCQDLSDRKQQIGNQLTSAVKGRAANQAYSDHDGNQTPRPAGANFEISG